MNSELAGKRPLRPLGKAVATCVLLLGMTPLASADGMGNADTLPDQMCMQQQFGKNLNCTANDIQIARATDIEILDDGCAFAGDYVDFIATFEVVLTAQARHDVGIYFATDGDPEGDGALTGTCTASTPAYATDPPWLDLDGTNDPFPGEKKPSGVQDTCGDIDNNHNPLFPRVTFTNVLCVAGENGQLKVPYCTSWRQPGSNELCTSPTQAIPGAPSKCKCDDGFTVPIDVPVPELLVTKTATPNNVNEPGAPVVYEVSVINQVPDPSNRVTLTQMLDNVYGNITVVQGDIRATNCELKTICGNGVGEDDCNPYETSPYTCQFTADVSGNGGEDVPDTVTVDGTDSNGIPVSGQDDANVHINDLLPAITVIKSVSPDNLPEPGGNVTFTVSVANASVADPVTIDSLLDDIHGDLNGQGSCSVNQEIPVGGNYMCTFTASVIGNSGDSETDTVTASGADDEGNPVSGFDSATVTITNTPSMITLLKTVNPTSLPEPGGSVEYTFKITNNSAVDTVFINALVDDKLFNLDGMGTCDVSPAVELAPSASYSCVVPNVDVAGNANSAHMNTATASGIDDDGQAVTDSDDATVTFNNVPPAASLTKDVESAAVTYAVEVCNDSTAETLTVTALVDDVYGDITQLQGAISASDCNTGAVLGVSGGGSGECYSCMFTATQNAASVTDTVTGTVEDDDDSTPASPSDSARVDLIDEPLPE